VETVNDINHYSALIKESIIKDKQNISNCFLMPDGINRYTQNSRMFWERVQNGIIFICEEKDFYYLYFYLNNQEITLYDKWREKFNKPVIIDLVHWESKKPQTLIGVENQLIINGFCQYKKYKRMLLDIHINKNSSTDQIFQKISFYQIGYAQSSDHSKIQSVWRNTLDIYSTPMPSDNELVELIEKKQIICGFEKNNKLVAALQIGLNRNTCYINRIAVDKGHRRHGLAQALLNYCFSFHHEVNKYFLWVEELNSPAIRLYLKNGFSFDGKKTNQLIMKN